MVVTLVWMLLRLQVVVLVVAESVVNVGERSQSRQPRGSNNVPSGSQTDMLPALVPQSERDD